MFPLNETGMLSGLLCGVLFGYVLENAGFGSPVKLSAQFKLTDWAVFKVMFTAIVVAAVGLWLLRFGGLLRPDSIAVPQAALMAAAVGGALVGAGFAVGGYCPGTSVAGLFSGRIDALVFILGVLLGTTGFAVFYGTALRSLKSAWLLVDGDTFTDVYAVPEPVVLAVLGLALIAVFYFGSWFERRGTGTITAVQAVEGAR
ncbi:MAG: YeeE/YedE thiosulfate transporter family protein [Sulfuritalea sp.]|nr:YeeE/YedE thiosulfate transporter family protein [Sulfuritalea sp.]MDP1984122.1 YeeE/YedE thiosulfate transporter family protein [Sulfuritalea sp.]